MKKNRWDMETEALSNEMKLLLLCSSPDISVEQQEKTQSMLKGNIAWSDFLKIVRKHRVFPTVYTNLSKIQGITINTKVLNYLERKFQQNLLNSIKLSSELIKINRLLQDNGVRVISLKGPLLAIALYGETSCRSSRDLDFLIAEQDVEKTEMLLLAAGYQNIDIDVREISTPKRKVNSIRTRHHYVYQNDAGIIVEIHWRYSYQFMHTDFDNLWDSRREQTISGSAIPVLSPEDEFVFLVIHGSIHGWNRLHWLVDIAAIVKQNRLQWCEVVTKADQMGVAAMLAQALILANQLYSIAIPEALKKTVDASQTGWIIAQMSLPFINNTDGKLLEPGDPLYYYAQKYNLIRWKGIKGKLSYLTTMVHPKLIDFQTVDFSDRYYFLYYLTRPFFKIRRMISKGS